MKKLFVCLVALLLALSAVALADMTVEAVETNSSVTLCEATNCYIDRAEDGYYLYDADGNALSAAYGYITPKQKGLYLEVVSVSATEDLNYLGLLDAQGREILPFAYADFQILDADWVLAFVIAPSDSDLGEYKDADGNKYIVTRTDVLYKGEIIGSLSREEFIKSYSVGAVGAYMYVKQDSTHVYWLDSSFNRVDVTDEDYVSTAEFSDIYKKGIFHNPTQQYAFVEGCTLTPDQVNQSVWLDTAAGTLLDLQGNVIASELYYDYAYFRSNYFIVKRNGLCGIVDLEGNEIVAPQYKEIAYDDGGLFTQGYTAVLDEKGCLSYLDVNGNVTASVEYELSSSDYKGFSFNAPIVAVKNMGKYMLISATHGELADKYDDVLSPKGTNSVIAVQKDGLWGVVDMAGNVVVPFELRWSPSISADGSLIQGSTEAREYFLYKVTGNVAEEPAVTESWTEPQTSGEDAQPEVELAEGAWQCTCGTINTGNFCAECGARKPEPTAAPVEDGSWTCDCGSVNTGKFCPECGAGRPEAAPAEPVCANCGYKPEGDAPKFCPECGTQF